MVFEYPVCVAERRPLEWRISSSLPPPRTRGVRCPHLELKSGMRLKHAPPALRTGAGSSRARFENQVPPRDCAAVRSTPSCGKSECCAARTHPARSALPPRTSRRPLPCFTRSLSVCFCSQLLRVPGSWRSTPSKKIGTCIPAPAAWSTAPPASQVCSAPRRLCICLTSLDICGTRSRKVVASMNRTAIGYRYGSPIGYTG